MGGCDRYFVVWACSMWVVNSDGRLGVMGDGNQVGQGIFGVWFASVRLDDMEMID